MYRLIQRGLMFGNLVHVQGASLVGRYNRALKRLTGRETALSDFHVDISGYSPEVGDELGDDLYLNHDGVNRQFILLTTAQKSAPLLNAQFSTARGILRQFIDDNEAQLFALTARDAVAGELLNSVYDISHPKRLFDIRQITIEADTTEGHVAQSAELTRKIEQFRQDPDGWWDDLLIAEMIGLAKKTGDVTRHPVALGQASFAQDNFWTSHFGGMYLFRGVAEPAVITSKHLQHKLPLPKFDLKRRNEIAIFLELNGLVEPIVKARGANAAAILQQKMDFIVADTVADQGVDLKGASRRDLRNLARRHAADLPGEFHGLAALLRWVTSGGPWPKITSEHPAYFYTLRARAHPDRDLVNRLLAELTTKDIRQLFICHKELFYRIYASWSDEKREYVADFLAREYQVDKAGTREALFGPEDPMEEPEPPTTDPEPDLIDLVGPWGAVRRRD